VILGGGPIGLAAGAILKRAGANKLILSEISETRSAIGKKMGFDHIINPVREDLAERILEYTSGIGAKIYIETTGSPHLLIKDIENTIMRGRKINSTVVLVSKTHDKIPITGEIFQIRNANIVGIEGDTGSNIFPKLIGLIESGMDLTPMVTSRITLEEVPQKINELNKSKIDCKVVAVV
jgi:threonine dehydrogenase-like Zn-dependent dehydrogenase